MKTVRGKTVNNLRRNLLFLVLPVTLLATQEAVPQSAFRPQIAQSFEALRGATPFQNNNGAVPPPNVYSGPMFVNVWPTQPLPPLTNAPWRAAINNGRINPGERRRLC